MGGEGEGVIRDGGRGRMYLRLVDAIAGEGARGGGEGAGNGEAEGARGGGEREGVVEVLEKAGGVRRRFHCCCGWVGGVIVYVLFGDMAPEGVNDFGCTPYVMGSVSRLVSVAYTT